MRGFACLWSHRKCVNIPIIFIPGVSLLCQVSGICMIAICFALCIRSYRRGVVGVKIEPVDLEGKLFIITGSNTGMYLPFVLLQLP